MSAERPVWRLFGFRVASHHAFVNHVPRVDGPADLLFDLIDDPDAPADAPISYSSPARLEEGEGFLDIIVLPDRDVMRFNGVAEFVVRPERITCRILDPAYAFMVELHLLGFVLSLWLERRGLLALHASGVVVDGAGVGFLATNKGGKSSLAATLARQGHPLLSDDIIPLEVDASGVRGRPSYPQMRMWRDLAAQFVPDVDALGTVHPRLDKRRVPLGPGTFGRLADAPAPLRCLYLPERAAVPAATVEPVAPGRTLVELARHSFLRGILESLGLHAARLPALARVAQHVPIRRLVYPEGFGELETVARAIVDDVRTVVAARP
jgi:hypothetical protein